MSQPARAFPWYLAGIVSWFASFGMQTIVFPWLVTVVLHEPPAVAFAAELGSQVQPFDLARRRGARNGRDRADHASTLDEDREHAAVREIVPEERKRRMTSDLQESRAAMRLS